MDQSTRIGELTTPLGKDVLVLTRFDGSEGLSELFEYRVEAGSTKENLPLKDLLGKPCFIKVKTIGGGTRHFAGIATEAQWLGVHDKLFNYRITLRPWLYLLSQRVNSRIFHKKDVTEIIAAIFGDYPDLATYSNRLEKSYPKLEYCVQFRESDLAFVLRLMEQHGISYHFNYGPSDHTMVLGDGKKALAEINGGKRDFYPLSGQYRREGEHFDTFVPERRFTTGKVTLNDYDFKKPTTSLKSEQAGSTDFEQGKLERYEPPGLYDNPGNGALYAKARMDGLRAADKRFHASGDCVTAQPGHLVTLAKHPTAALNKQYLVLRCFHSVVAETYRSGGGGGGSDGAYTGSYELLDADVHFAPPRITPSPVISGPQTAVVTGRGEVDCDEHGRILVQFHWEREGEKSMRCRVAQVWGGPKWGGVFIPRVGMEVLVQFLDGNPDRPMVIGSVYNADNMPPYPLPEKNLISGWKSNSSPGGGGYNEFVFDDTKGKELVRMHAQFDHETKILNDERRDVGHDRKSEVKNDETLKVGHDIMITAEHMITLKVGMSKIVMDGQSITISSPTVTVKASQTFESKAGINSDHKAGGMMTLVAPMIKIN